MRCMDVSEILDELNDAQRDAVAAPIGHSLVLAGAGSGKTRVLVHRIAWLTQVENVSPHGIMAVTFTNKAAREMRERIEQMLKIPTRGLWIGTFHGLAHRLLKQHWLEARLPQNFQVLDSEDQLRVIKRVHKELMLDDSQWPPKQSQYFINAQKDEGLRAEHVDAGGDFYQKTMQKVYAAYQDACYRSGLVDFAEILLRSHELWLNNPEVLAHYQQRFSHLLVDEFQDTNTIQYAWLRVLAGKKMSVMAVGDDDQSIYGWRGAKIENIQRFSEDFDGTQLVRLEQNYRSTSTILQAANAVIAYNQARLGKELWTQDEGGELIDVYAAFNEHDEARYVVEKIQSDLAKTNLKKSDIAILYRSNAQSRVLEECFIRANIAYRIYGGQRFYERLEIKHVMAYVRLALNHDDDAACDRVLNIPPRGIGNKSATTLREFARDHGCSLWQAIEKSIEQKLLPPRACGSLQGFLTLVDEFSTMAKDVEELDEFFDEVIKRTALREYFAKEKGEKAQARLDNIDELITAAADFLADDSQEITELQQFADNAALDAGEGQADEFEDSVQLMTLHSAKGLEFELVYLVGMEENLFPHKMSMDDFSRLEEERRLCYVGITRAKQKLCLSYAEIRRLHGSENYNKPSRFLREIPEALMQQVRAQQSFSQPVSQTAALKTVEIDDCAVVLGSQVAHAKFGEGIVTNLEGKGASARVQVNFAECGSKWLVLQYANLTVL